MKNLTTAIKSKISGTALDRLVGRRVYKGRAPIGTKYPYIVFFVVSDVQYDTFKSKLDDVSIQFSLFSTASSTDEIDEIYDELKELMDDAILRITGATQCLLYRENTIMMSEEPMVTPDGTKETWHYAVDYNIIQERG